MGQRRKFSAEYKHEAVAIRDGPGAAVSQIAAELGLGPMSWDGAQSSVEME
jgi:transposase-like protein